MTEANKKSAKTKWLRNLEIVIVTAAVFGLGFAFGNGNIKLGGYKAAQNNLPEDLDYSSVEKVYDALKESYDGKLDAAKLMDGIKHGLTQASGDPYTDYFSPKEAQNFEEQLNGTFQGIGAELGKDDNNNLIVVSPIAGFPAEKAGLKSKDIIAEVNGASTVNMSVDQAVSKIRGPKGTVVTLKIIRGTTPITLKITRDEIKIPSVTSKTLPGNIGYIKISVFSEDSAKLAAEAASGLKQAGVKGVVLDLRGNPGGSLPASVDLSSLWLKKDATVLTERRDGSVIKTYKASGDNPLYGIKTVVLIDGGSASASEITAGALRDNNVATLMGVKSFGKGSVQQIIELGDGSEVKITIARWFRPNGKNIDKQGIEPDTKVERSDDDIKNSKDPQLDAATAQLSK